MKKIRLLLLLLSLMCTMLSGMSSQELYKKLNNTYGNIKSYQAEVKQDNYFAQIKKSISYQGRIYFSQGRMLMHFTKPNVQRLYISGGKAELYDAQSKTLFRSAIKPEFGKMNPVEILQTYWTKSQVKLTGTSGNISNVQLLPAKDPMISRITASINHKTGLISKLAYTDASGNQVSYTFTAVKLNGGIPASVWNYTYPKGVQVIQQ